MPYFIKPFCVSDDEMLEIAEEEKKIFRKAAIFAMSKTIYRLRNFGIRFTFIRKSDVCDKDKKVEEMEI